MLRYMNSLPFWTVTLLGPILARSASEAPSRSWPGPLTVEPAQTMLAEPRNQPPLGHNGKPGCSAKIHNRRLITVPYPGSK